MTCSNASKSLVWFCRTRPSYHPWHASWWKTCSINVFFKKTNRGWRWWQLEARSLMGTVDGRKCEKMSSIVSVKSLALGFSQQRSDRAMKDWQADSCWTGTLTRDIIPSLTKLWQDNWQFPINNSLVISFVRTALSAILFLAFDRTISVMITQNGDIII